MNRANEKLLLGRRAQPNKIRGNSTGLTKRRERAGVGGEESEEDGKTGAV